MSQAHERRRVAIYVWEATARDHEAHGATLEILRSFAQEREMDVVAEYVERTPGATQHRLGPAYRALMAAASEREFDAVLVYRYDHIARSQLALLNVLKTLQLLGTDFISYQEGVDTTTPEGAAVLAFMASLRQFDDALSESIRIGMTAAKAIGKRAARPPIAEELQRQIRALHDEDVPVSQISKRLGIAYGTAWNYVRRLQEEEGKDGEAR